MNFLDLEEKFPGASGWFRQLRDEGKKCDSTAFSDYFSGNNGVPRQYMAAVAWHNIEVDGRLQFKEQKVLTQLINAAWDNSAGRSRPPLIDILRFQRRPTDADFEKRFLEELSAVGPPPGISPDDPGYEILCSLVQPRILPGRLADIDGPLMSILEIDNPIVWLTRYDDIKDCLQGSGSAEEALCRAGLERNVSKPIYLLMVQTREILDDLRIPTAADSRLYYMFGATADGPTGMARHTTEGKEKGIPEFIVRRQRLREIHEQAVAAGNPSPVSIHPGQWESGTPCISRKHAESRWNDEIKTDILK